MALRVIVHTHPQNLILCHFNLIMPFQFLTGEPTVQEKAEVFIKALNLGYSPGQPTQQPLPVTRPPTPRYWGWNRYRQPPPTTTVGDPNIQRCPSGTHIICPTRKLHTCWLNLNSDNITTMVHKIYYYCLNRYLY